MNTQLHKVIRQIVWLTSLASLLVPTSLLAGASTYSARADWIAALGGSAGVLELHFDGPTESDGVFVNDPVISPPYSSLGFSFLPFTGIAVYPVIRRGVQGWIPEPNHDALVDNESSPNGDLDGRAIKLEFTIPINSVAMSFGTGDGGYVQLFGVETNLIGESPICVAGGFIGMISEQLIKRVAIINTFNEDITFGIWDLEYKPLLSEPHQPPRIWSQPVGQTTFASETVLLNVLATGEWPLTYQWRKDGLDVAGATNSTLVISNAAVAATGDYTVVVSNDFGSVPSDVAHVTVTERPWPYFENFEGAVGPEWSNRKIDVTPVGNRRFLGQFGNESIMLNLGGLPAHQGVTVSFDLFVIGSWDGNDTAPGNGPDIWDLSVAGGPTLLHTTFTVFEQYRQSFPDSYPGGSHPTRTGAVENNTLGWGDSVYHLVLTFPHTADTLTLNFSGQESSPVYDESWGLDNVRVELNPTPPEVHAYVQTSVASIGTWSPTNNLPVSGISASGTRALARLGSSGVRLLDLSYPAAPAALGSWNTLLPLSDAVLAGNLAYLASWETDFLSTVEIVDFTNPANPVLLGYYDTPGYALDLTVVGGLVYVADAEGGLLILDVSDPAWPRRVGGFDPKGTVQRVEVYGNRAYVADGNWLVTLDLSDPFNPRRIGLYEVAGGIQSLKAYGTKLYLSEGTGDLRILNAGNPANIQSLGTYRGWGNPAQGLAVSGRYLYLAKGTGGLHVLDVSDPAKPTYLTGAWSSSAEDVAPMGKYALVAGGDKGLVVYEVQQHLYPPLKPPVISGDTMTLTWATTNGVWLQKATNLTSPVWQDIPASEGTNLLTLPITEPTAFFRLVKRPQPIQPPPGMVAWWSGDGNALDLVGTHHGTLINGVTFAPGMVGQAFYLNGTSSCVVIPDSPSLRLRTMTVEGWFSCSTSAGLRHIVARPLGSGWLDSFAVVVSDGVLLATICNTPDVCSWVSKTLSPVPGEWHHFAYAVNDETSTHTLFVDGTVVDTSQLSMSIVLDQHPIILGADLDNESLAAFFEGLIDEVHLFDRQLSAAEIKAIYEAGSAGIVKPSR